MSRCVTVDGDKALIVDHCALFGRHEWLVRKFSVSEVRPYAQYERSVSVDFVKPRKRTWQRTAVLENNRRYITIESADGELIYDSRSDIPCDMDQWEATRCEFEGRAGFHVEVIDTTRGHSDDRLDEAAGRAVRVGGDG